ncbi:hypothetical protein AB205_0097120 [Aquarana catesbeiana]|uniref:Uncharacterized protein n=1 Tax=Aquarana catesbeiana TaxID=8400 RepID=A0A2G9SGP8_AQUCT|nr:hypothetical protein AB205_0097120 [Aquarana catesbeiana]
MSCLFRTKVYPAAETVVFNELFRASILQSALQQKILRVDVCSAGRPHREECLAGIQISLADLSLTNEAYTRWHTLMPCRHISHQKALPKKSVLEARETQAATVNMDAVSALLVRTSAELEAVKRELAQVEADEEDQEQTCLGEEWLELQGEEASDAIDEPGPTEHMNEYYSSPLQLSTDPEEPQTESYDGTNSWDSTSTPLPAAELPTLVDKETNTEETVHENISVRPKDRSSLSGRQRPFVRNSMIVRSQTFSPGEKNQYICRVSGLIIRTFTYKKDACLPI